MEIELQSQPLVSTVEKCGKLLCNYRIFVCMGNRLTLGSFCISPIIRPSLVGAATTENEAVDLVSRYNANLIIATEVLEEGYGIRMIERIKRQWPETICLIFLERQTSLVVTESLHSGANGVMFTSNLCTGRGDFISALIAVSEGRLFYPSEVKALASLPFEVSDLPLLDTLSQREIQVITLIANGSTNNEIAAQLSVTLETIKSHVRTSIQKLGVRDRTELAVKALIHGLIKPQF